MHTPELFPRYIVKAHAEGANQVRMFYYQNEFSEEMIRTFRRSKVCEFNV